MAKSIGQLFITAYNTVCENGYSWEIDRVRHIKPLSEQEPIIFFIEYVWVVLNAGMKEQVARKIFNLFLEDLNLNKIGHLSKRSAIQTALTSYEKWFSELQKAENKLSYLESLPWIGPITKYHLGRNIGIDTVKPDRHLVRLAEKYGYASPLELCQDIKKEFSEPLGVIDVILWRYCNLGGERDLISKDSNLSAFQ